jgi:lipopolysaccharide biosynthesis protein
MPSYKKIALYASYQTGKDLPGYVRFALRHLAATDFHVVLLTNDRELSEETYKFIADNDIELFFTQNHGFDFGMWHRYLKLKVNNPTAGVAQESMGNLDRLLVLNDSIVYFQNNFEKFFAEAEKSTADVVSLTSSNEIYPHLQSFFLYMKQPALGAFFMHLFETPEQEDFLSTVRHMEIGLSEKFVEAEVRMEALYPTEGKALFSARELIEQGAGFIKRKLLQRRFNFDEKVYFIRMGAKDVLNTDYAAIVKQAGLAHDFKEEWLPTAVDSPLRHKADLLWEGAFDKVGWPLLRTAIKTKYKLLGKPLEGDEYK